MSHTPELLDELKSASERVQQARIDFDAGDLEGGQIVLETLLQEIDSAISKATGSEVQHG